METSGNSVQLSIEDWLILLAGDPPASLSVSPGSERAKKMTDTSFRKHYALLKKQGPGGLFWKMLLDCSPFWSRRVYLKWNIKRLSFFVQTTTRTQTVLLSEYNAGSLEQLLEKLDQRDMYFHNWKMARFCVFQLAPLMLRTGATRLVCCLRQWPRTTRSA